MTTPCEPVKRRPRRVKPAVGTVEHVQQTGWKTVAQPTARNLPAALLSLNRRLFLALSHGSAILTQHPICSTPPLRNLPLIHRYDECLLWVGTSSWQNGKAAVRPRLTLERQVTSTLLPDCAIEPPAAEADKHPLEEYSPCRTLKPPPDSIRSLVSRGNVGGRISPAQLFCDDCRQFPTIV